MHSIHELILGGAAAPPYQIDFGCLILAAILLGRRLPAQNVLFILATLSVVEAAVDYGFKTGNILECSMFWTGIIVLSRIAGQSLLKAWRRSPNYGLFLLGLASAETAFVQIFFGGLISALGRLMLTVGCLLFLTPWFLQKRLTASSESKARG
ncbi:MAG TPA: hypothetical protein VGO67_00430 [Verrucomicrobiae bacterium]